MRPWLWLRVGPILCLGMILLPPCAHGADEEGVTKDLHPWGRFYNHRGAWKRYRVVTETLDAAGQVAGTSITETKTSLEEADDEGVTLRVESIVEIAGKRLSAEPKRVRQGLRGDGAIGKAVVRNVGAGHVVIEGQKIPCRVEEAEIDGPNGKTVTRTYYSRFLPPYVLQRESKTTGPDGKVVEEHSFRVLSLDRPCAVVPQIRRAAWVEAVSTTPNGSTVTRAYTSIKVPGGVICHDTDERDPQGRLVRHSRLVLLDFGLEPDKEEGADLGRVRGRGRRANRAGSP